MDTAHPRGEVASHPIHPPPGSAPDIAQMVQNASVVLLTATQYVLSVASQLAAA